MCPRRMKRCGPRKRHTKQITKVAAKTPRKYSSECDMFAVGALGLGRFDGFYICSCDTCGLTFLSEYKLYCHSKETHQLMPFKCIEAKCVESYATQEQLDQHTKQNHSRVNCPHCNKMIKLYYLPLHIKFYHDKDQRIICDLCGNVSNNINTHKSHHRLVHDIQPRLQCDICKDWWEHCWIISFIENQTDWTGFVCCFSGRETRIVFGSTCVWGIFKCPKCARFAGKCRPTKRRWWNIRNSTLPKLEKNSNAMYAVAASEIAQSSR